MSRFRNITVTNTSTLIKNKGGDLNSYHIVNRHNAAIFVKLYDLPVATFQDTPIDVIQVGANASVTVGNISTIQHSFSTALSIRVVTEAADNGNTAAGTLPIIQIEYN